MAGSDFEKAKSYFLEGAFHAENENWEQAEVAFKASQNILPGRASTVSNLLGVLVAQKKYDEAWIIGGEEIYKLFLNNNLIDMCSITYINHKFHCDTFFPKFGKEWLMKEYYKLDNQKNYDVNIVTIVRNDN